MKTLLRNYILISLRLLWRNKIYSLINILGISLGLACSYIVLLYATSELAIDKYHANYQKIFRLTTTIKDMGHQEPQSSYLLGKLLKNDIPEIEEACRIRRTPAYSEKEEERIRLNSLYSTEESFFKIFTTKLIYGSSGNLLQAPTDLVVSKSAAMKHFNKANPVGEELELVVDTTRLTMIVTGVYEDFPIHSSFRPAYLTSLDLANIWLGQFYSNDEIKNSVNARNYQVFFKMGSNANIDKVLGKVKELQAKHTEDVGIALGVQPFSNTYLHSGQLLNDFCRHGDYNALRYYSIIGLLILLMSCFNYTLMNIARSTARLKEIGIRKVIGANKRLVRHQVLTESIILSIVSLPVALVLAKLSLPLFNGYLNKSIMLDFDVDPKYLLLIIFVTLFAGVLSGSYIAFYIARFDPIGLFRQKLSLGSSKSFFTNGIIVAQLVVFIALFSSIFIINKQINYMLNKDLGLSKENIVMLYPPMDAGNNIHLFVNEVRQYGGVEQVTAGSPLPPTNSFAKYSVEHPFEQGKRVSVEAYSVDYDFLNTYQIKLLAGRFFLAENKTDDSLALVINETAVKELGYKEWPIGEKIGSQRVVGVVQDFNVHSLHSKVKPYMITLCKKEWMNDVAVRLDGAKNSETLKSLEQAWGKFFPDKNFAYYYFDDFLKRFYWKENNLKKTLSFFSLLAIFISLLGLFGFILYTMHRRKKEIAIKKVLGAGNRDILYSVSKKFVGLVVLSTIASVPISWYFMQLWLQDFAYHTNISPLIYVAAFILTALIVISIVSLQTIAVVKSNLINYIKNE